MFKKNKIIIVAEIGNNHEGSLKTAKLLMKEAKKCGVDAVKFQTFIPDLYVHKKDKKRFKQLKKFQLSFDDFEKLALFAKKLKITFFSTPFDLESASFLNKIQKVFKISSGDNNFIPLINHIAKFNKPIILSTGMSDIQMVRKSKNIIFNIWKKNKNNRKKLIIMHCVSSYPTESKEANLLAIKTLIKNFKDCTIGYSDHTKNILSAITSVSLGAKVIERHFTLSKNFSRFRDHKLSSDPKEMRQLVDSVRFVEKAMGTGKKKLQKSEKKIINFVRRGAVAYSNISKGKKIWKNNIKWVRVKNGIKINNERKILGKTLKRNVKKDQVFKLSYFKN